MDRIIRTTGARPFRKCDDGEARDGHRACLLIQHTLKGSAGEPAPSSVKRRRWGAGEIETLFEGQVHNGRTILRLEDMSGESYSAFLSFARFPDLMAFPDGEPWLHFADSLPFPVEISSRMKLIP